MKYRKKIIMFLIVWLIAVFPHRSNAQEVFPDQAPSQEFIQNKNAAPGGILKAGGGTGSGDPIDPGTGGTDPNGSQNDTAVTVTDATWLLILLALGYGTLKRRKLSTGCFTPKSPKGDLGER